MKNSFKNDRRLIVALLLVTSLAVLIAFVRPRANTVGLAYNVFWANKFAAPPAFDVVLGGDSRVYRGVAPEELQKVVPGIRVLNFGFSSAPLNARYFHATAAKLDPQSEKKILIFGITPNSLTKRSVVDNGFDAIEKNVNQYGVPAMKSWRNDLEALLDHFRPFSIRDLKSLARHSEVHGYFQNFHADGWVGSIVIPLNPRAAIPDYRRNFEDNPVSEGIVQEFLAAVKSATQQGVQVYGYRPPISSDLAAVERELAQFNAEDFKRRWTQAGAIWLEPKDSGYDSYDGSHLTEASALKFTKELATELSRAMEKKEG